MITIRELARIAGVSPATVSKALNNQSDISEAMKEQIFALAKEYGYEKKHAVAAATGPFSEIRVGIMFDDMYSNYYSRLIECFCDKIYQMNGIPFLLDRLFSDERGKELCQYLKKNRIVDGIIYVSGDERKLKLEELNFPVVTCQMGLRTELIPVDGLFIEVLPGLEAGIRLLLEQGHTYFAFLGETQSARTGQLFRMLMEKYHIPQEQQYFDMTDVRFEDAGYQLMERLFTCSRMPSALVCAYDNIAVGAALSIRDHGFSVPEHFSMIGVDDSRLMVGRGRRVSSVDRKIQEQVDIVMALLQKRIKDPGSAVQNVKVLSGFSPGDTIGPRAAWVNRPDEKV